LIDFSHVAGPSFEDVAARYPGVEFVGARLRFSPERFTRTLAKIAYCWAVYVLGVEALRHSPIRDVILGNDPHISRWVGSWEGERMTNPDDLHAIQVHALDSNVHVLLRLFGQLGGPEYHIILGPAQESFFRSPHWPWK